MTESLLPSSNPYLAFSALLLAGLDGIKNKIEPPAPIDKNIHESTGPHPSVRSRQEWRPPAKTSFDVFQRRPPFLADVLTRAQATTLDPSGDMTAEDHQTSTPPSQQRGFRLRWGASHHRRRP